MRRKVCLIFLWKKIEKIRYTVKFPDKLRRSFVPLLKEAVRSVLSDIEGNRTEQSFEVGQRCVKNPKRPKEEFRMDLGSTKREVSLYTINKLAEPKNHL